MAARLQRAPSAWFPRQPDSDGARFLVRTGMHALMEKRAGFSKRPDQRRGESHPVMYLGGGLYHRLAATCSQATLRLYPGLSGGRWRPVTERIPLACHLALHLQEVRSGSSCGLAADGTVRHRWPPLEAKTNHHARSIVAFKCARIATQCVRAHFFIEPVRLAGICRWVMRLLH